MQELLRKLVNNGDEVYGQPCTVESINGLLAVCQPINGDAEIHEVRLVADDSTELFILVPAVGSIVIVEFLSKDEAYISMVSKVSEIKLKIGLSLYKASPDGFEFSKGNDTLWEAFKLLYESLEVAFIAQGKNIDRIKLAASKAKIKNILNGT